MDTEPRQLIDRWRQVYRGIVGRPAKHQSQFDIGYATAHRHCAEQLQALVEKRECRDPWTDRSDIDNEQDGRNG